MENFQEVSSTDTMVYLVDLNYNVLPLFSRFSIPLGFSEKTVAEVCKENNIDVNLFLLIINYVLFGNLNKELISMVNPLGVVSFLRNSHDYFRSYKLPHIRKNLVQALDEKLGDINPSILEFFDNYVKRIEVHFRYEERKVFPYVEALSAEQSSEYGIDVFRRHHDDEPETILTELKNIILRYYPTSLPNKMYDVLVDLCNCEEDLKSHTDIENEILIPAVTALENKRKK